MKRIFLIGSERSGTNLLRVLLGNHRDISAPPPVHLCDVLYNRRSLYEGYDKPRLIDLVSRIERYINYDLTDWKLDLDPAVFLEKYVPGSIPEILDGVYSERAIAEGKGAYFCKDNHIQTYALGIKARFPDSHFVYIYRDPRDQVASWVKSRMFLTTPYAAARKWLSDQEQCSALRTFYGLNLIPVKYEELIESTDAVMSRLLEGLGMEVDPACFETSGNNPEARKHELWKNLDKPVIKENKRKYREVLSDSMVELVETLCQDHMRGLGYELDTPARYEFGNQYIWKIKERIRSRMIRKTAGVSVIHEKDKFIKDVFG